MVGQTSSTTFIRMAAVVVIFSKSGLRIGAHHRNQTIKSINSHCIAMFITCEFLIFPNKVL